MNIFKFELFQVQLFQNVENFKFVSNFGIKLSRKTLKMDAFGLFLERKFHWTEIRSCKLDLQTSEYWRKQKTLFLSYSQLKATLSGTMRQWRNSESARLVYWKIHIDHVVTSCVCVYHHVCIIMCTSCVWSCNYIMCVCVCYHVNFW